MNMATADDAAEYFAEVVAHHEAMIDAIRRRDADAADRLAGEHAKLFRARIMRFVAASAAGDVSVGAISAEATASASLLKTSSA